jgi:hypothetical protein
VAAQVTPAVTLNSSDGLYRAINPNFYQDGALTTGVFFMKKRDKLEEGPSVGIEKLIPLDSFHTFKPKWGVGQFPVSVPIELKLRVHPLPDETWGPYSQAHAVITDYQSLTNSRINEVQRALRDQLQKNILILPQM